eukprot:RCo054998
MSLVEKVSEHLGRSLGPDEEELIQSLSAQGVAKLNADLVKEIDLEQTLAELMMVFQAVKRCRAQAESSVPGVMRSLVAEMKRPPTLSEMILLTDVSCDVLLERLNPQLMAGVDLDDAIEELAEAHRFKLMQLDAKRLANAEGKTVRLCALPPSELLCSDVVGPTVSVLERADKLRMGPGALMSWFCESATKNHDGQVSGSPRRCGPRPVLPGLASSLSLPASLATCTSLCSSPSLCPTTELQTPESTPRRRAKGKASPARSLHVSFAAPRDAEVVNFEPCLFALPDPEPLRQSASEFPPAHPSLKHASPSPQHRPNLISSR